MTGRYVAVVGPNVPGATDADCANAREAGRLLAEAGCVVVCGGLGGVMSAAAEGASTAGGRSVGLLPGTDRTGAATDLTVAIPTGLGQGRNALVVAAAHGVLAIGGSWGTLSEIAMARRTGVPVVCVGGWSVHDADGKELELHAAVSAEQAVARLLELMEPAAGS